MHRVDVIIPCFNYARFLERSLGSVVAQTFGDFRVLVIDNASTDATPDVVKAWQERDSRIDYVRNETNIGLFGSCRKALNLTKAPYVVILPADDYWTPRFLGITAGALDDFPEAPMAYCRWAKDHGASRFSTIPFPHGRDGLYDDSAPLLIYNWIPLSFGLFRRKAMEEVGGLSERFTQLLDLDFWLRLSRKGPFFYGDEIGGYLGFHETNLTKDLVRQGQSALEDSLLRHEIFLDVEGWPTHCRLLAKAQEACLLTGSSLFVAIDGVARTFGATREDHDRMREVASLTWAGHGLRYRPSSSRVIAAGQAVTIKAIRAARRLWMIWRHEAHRGEKTRQLLNQFVFTVARHPDQSREKV